MNGLILSGGELKGAWQAGALKALARRGWRPDFISGTSVGAINALLLAHYLGAGQDWPDAVASLERLWLDRVTGTDVLLRVRHKTALLTDLVQDRWGGLWDMGPLKELLMRVVEPANVVRCPIPVQASVWDAASGQVRSYPIGFFPAVASAMMPVMMAGVNDAYFDGGVMDIAPLKPAIDAGCTDLTAIVCQPSDTHFGPTASLLDLVGRVLHSMTTEIVNNDLAVCQRVNAAVAAGTDTGHRAIRLRVIRPTHPIPFDMLHFTPADIAWMIDQGNVRGELVLMEDAYVPA